MNYETQLDETPLRLHVSGCDCERCVVAEIRNLAEAILDTEGSLCNPDEQDCLRLAKLVKSIF